MFFDSIKKIGGLKVRPSTTFGACSITVFRPSKDGVIHSKDLSSDSGNFEDFSADRLVSAGVDVAESSKPFDDVTLNTLDDVDVNVSKILDAENVKNQVINSNSNS